jgi:hypothetical protein
MVKLAVGLGFTVACPHNEAYVQVESEDKLVEISTKAGFSASFYNDVENIIIG